MGAITEANIQHRRVTRTDRWAPKLTEEEKHLAIQWHAAFMPQAEIVRRIRTQFGKSITSSTLSLMMQAPKWRPMIDRLRQEWAAGVMDLPAAHKRTRMAQLSGLYERIEHDRHLSAPRRYYLLLDTLDHMREEMDEKHTHFTTIFQTAIMNYSDTELLKRREEVLEQLASLRAQGKLLPQSVPATITAIRGGSHGQGSNGSHE